MISYFINLFLCSAVLFLFYSLFLEKEKCHTFNRIYLIISLIASAVIPALTRKTTPKDAIYAYNTLTDSIAYGEYVTPSETVMSSSPVNTFHITDHLLTAYVIIALLLLSWSIYKFVKLLITSNNYNTVFHKGIPIKLTDDFTEPFSFLNSIFIYKRDFISGTIRDEVIVHEMAHVNQYHTLDVLFLEIYHAVFWLNPLLIFYRRAIVTNHEFLADQAVLKKYPHVKTYQMLLLNSIASKKSPAWASKFFGSSDYYITKKRLLKMKRKNTIALSLLKQVAVIPVFAIAFYFFSQKVHAQPDPSEPEVKTATVRNQSYPCPEWGTVYCAVLKNYDLKGIRMDQLHKFISESDQQKMTEIFLNLSPEEQASQIVGFRLIGGTLKKNIPGQDQFESWKDEKLYGVWINNSRVENEALNNYTADDFSYFFISRLTKTAKNYGKHVYQLNLMTNNHFTNFNLNAKKRYHLYFLRKSPD